ncbi:beta-galactosidase [Paraglaciecola sp.]|uniref:beta-galactosidase n=1 Tax=Paraglaciecola sp. TaxID=1920173 RepID=UPI003EF8DF3B
MFTSLIDTPLKVTLLTSMVLLGCGPNNSQESESLVKESPKTEILSLLDFENEQYLELMKFSHVQSQLVAKHQDMKQESASQKGVTQGNQALAITLSAKDNYKSSFSFEPTSSWDWQALGEFKVALDITNPADLSAQIYLTVTDGKGQTHNRSVIVPKQSSETYTVELAGGDLGLETGIRSNPKAENDKTVPVTWRWGVKQLDLSQIKSIKISMTSLLHDRTLIIDDLRLIKGAEYSLDNLTNIVDEYGQNANVDFAIKVHSDEELIEFKNKEEAAMSGGLLADRSRFGGWKSGPKLDATGFFRTEKYQGKWSLVDPDGYLFFSHGLANVRMSNTSTVTGVDFDENLVGKRDVNDLTPEDSKGLNTMQGEVLDTQYVSSSLRRNMFTWLPDYNHDLANHYGYRREVHTGAIEKGETFSFYRANLERKYGERGPESFLNDWRQSTLDRMNDWGFTSFGNWIDPTFYDQQQVPYFANGWVIGNFKTVSSGNDYWSALPDPFDPEFAVRARVTVEAIAEQVKNSPWCVGVFIDNEKSWGNTGSISGQYGIVINTLSLADKYSPTKTKFTQVLKDKYSSISAFNQAWNTHFEVWQDVSNGIVVTEHTDAMVEDYSTLLYTYANQYFAVVKSELKRVLPNHLYMGVRFADWGMTPEVVQASADNVDVVSYNYYKEGLQKDYWAFLKDVDMPSIIGEFHIGATDSGLFNPGLVHAEDQADRARMYEEYMQSVIQNPYLVGAHWFQYTDSPITGRAYDGENYNVGFVSVTDTPYKEMVDAAKRFNGSLYQTKFGPSKN